MQKLGNSCLLLSVFVVAGPAFAGHSVQAAGPISELYLTSGEDSIVGIQGPNVLFNAPQSPGGQIQSTIAVKGTIRTIGYSGGRTGAEYTLTGTPTGTTYPFPASLGTNRFFDGTTDGNFNYAWNLDTNSAYRFSLTWTNPVSLFTLPGGSPNHIAITYDGGNASLWVGEFSQAGASVISDYSMNGTLLSSFIIDVNSEDTALALDPVDGTLWFDDVLASTSTRLVLDQYPRSAPGTFNTQESALSTQAYTGLNGTNTYGAEFQFTAVPEPSAGTIVICALGLLGRRSRQK